MNNNHDLTVAICVFNGEKYISETLESLFQQTYRKFDLLIIDDCSTDRTVDIVKVFFRNNNWNNTTIVSLPKNQGLAQARKYGEQVIQSELVQFFDADDVANPHMVEKLYAIMAQEPDCMGASCFCEYITPDSNKIGGGIYIGPQTKEDFMAKAQALKLMFLPPATMFRLKIANLVGGRAVEGFPEGKIRYQDMCEDLDLWTRMSDFHSSGKYFLVVPEILFGYRKHVTSISSSSKPMNDRMRHIKGNLKRRQQGLKDITFVDFMAKRSKFERFKCYFHDRSSDFYKQAGFCYMQKKYFRFLINLGTACVFSPGYVWQKLQHNAMNSPKISSE